MENKKLKHSEYTDIKMLELLTDSNIYFSKTQKNFEKFFNEIIDFNSKKRNISFSDFYKENNEEDNFSETNLRVKKTRLNKILQQYNYKITTDYNIVEIKNDFSLKDILADAIRQISNIKIKKIRIFDSFDSEQKKYLYSPEHKDAILIKQILKKDNPSIEIISIISDENTRDFYQDLLSLDGEYNICLKYLRFPVIMNSPIFFTLIEDINNKRYFLYYEENTNYFINQSITNDDKFYKSLNLRFNDLFNSKKLEDKNYILSIKKNVFQKSFENSVNYLIKNIDKMLNLKNLDEQTIIKETSKLIKYLLKMKISFPNMDYSYSVLYHHIKLLQALLFFKNTYKLEHTEYVFEKLVHSKVLDKLIYAITTESSKEELLIKEKDMNNLINIRKNIFSQIVNKKKTLVDIFDSMLWNTAETIRESFNYILQDISLLENFLCSFLRNEKPRKDLIKTKDIILFKYIIRIILSFYDIPKPKTVHIEFKKEEKELLYKLTFYNKDMEKKYYEILDKENLKEMEDVRY